MIVEQLLEKQIIEPKVRGFICTTAHPQGCIKMVEQQIAYIKKQVNLIGPKRILILGSSTGYGLASRIVATFGLQAKTIGVFFEKAAEKGRTATAGWYNTASFENFANQESYYAKSINGDAFSNEIKQQVIDLIKKDWGQVDLVIYSLATPRRLDPTTQTTFTATLKPTKKSFTSKTVDPMRQQIKQITLEPASSEEIDNTVAVMGGQDWELWIEALNEHQCLAHGFQTIAYSYIGPKLTYPIYKEGTIGQAKADLEKTSIRLEQKLKPYNGHAYISINKALVTQASSAIPVVPLYISLLYKVMKANHTHEGCIEQIYRLFAGLYGKGELVHDNPNRFRLDDLEMKQDTQNEISRLWEQVDNNNLMTLTDLKGYQEDFYRLFGFQLPNIDYRLPQQIQMNIPSIS